MRRIAISAAVIGGVVVAARVLAPKLHARMLATCKGMFEQMPVQCVLDQRLPDGIGRRKNQGRKLGDVDIGGPEGQQTDKDDNRQQGASE